MTRSTAELSGASIPARHRWVHPTGAVVGGLAVVARGPWRLPHAVAGGLESAWVVPPDSQECDGWVSRAADL
jgi:hypothetical protein